MNIRLGQSGKEEGNSGIAYVEMLDLVGVQLALFLEEALVVLEARLSVGRLRPLPRVLHVSLRVNRVRVPLEVDIQYSSMYYKENTKL